MTAAERRARQLEVTRRLWRLLFKTESEPRLCMTWQNLQSKSVKSIVKKSAIALLGSHRLCGLDGWYCLLSLQ